MLKSGDWHSAKISDSSRSIGAARFDQLGDRNLGRDAQHAVHVGDEQIAGLDAEPRDRDRFVVGDERAVTVRR